MVSLAGPDALTADTNVTVEFDCSEDDCTFLCALESTTQGSIFPERACETGTELGPLNSDAYTFSVVAVDAAGNRGIASEYRWQTDATAPTIVDLAGPEAISSATDATLTFDCSESDCAFSCELTGDSQGVVRSDPDCDSGVSYNGLTNDVYTFTVSPTDGVGNTGESASWQWSVDSEPLVLWVRTVDSEESATINDASATNDGVAVFGNFKLTVDFGDATIEGRVSNNTVYVARYSPVGDELWAAVVGAPDTPGITEPGDDRAVISSFGQDVYLNDSGAVLVVGSMGLSGAMGSGIQTQPSASYLSPTGAFVWEVVFPGTPTFGFTGGALNALGQPVVLGGQDRGRGKDLYLARLDPANGAVVDSLQTDDPGRHQLWKTAHDDQGNMLVLVAFDDALDLGNGQTVTADGGGSFIARFSPSLDAQWVLPLVGTGIPPLTTHPNGDSSLFLRFRSGETLTVGDLTLTSAADNAAGLCRLTATGEVRWCRVFETFGGDVDITAIAGHSSGQTLLIGTLEGALSFEGDEVMDTDGAVILAVSDDGELVNTEVFGTPSTLIVPRTVATAPDGSIYVGGFFRDDVVFGGLGFSQSTGTFDGFLLSVDPALVTAP